MKQITYIHFILLLSIFISLSGSVFAQQKNNDAMIILNVAPMAMLDFFDGPSLRIGAEFKIKNTVFFALESGQYLCYLKSTKINPSGYLIRPSIKKYFNGKDSSGKFIGIEYQYKNQHYDLKDSIGIFDMNYEKRYSMQRVIHAVVIKFGAMIPLTERFMIEWFCGIGIRHIRSYSSLTAEENNAILFDSECPIQKDFIRQSGTHLFPDFRAGIKIGFKIK